jgi:hypothetical protein
VLNHGLYYGQLVLNLVVPKLEQVYALFLATRSLVSVVVTILGRMEEHAVYFHSELVLWPIAIQLVGRNGFSVIDDALR